MSKRANRKSKGDYELIVPTRAGKDLHNKDMTIDGHIRIENYKESGTNIYIDLFVSKVKDADRAHITSESFPWTDEGANKATRFLQENGFRGVVMLK